MFLSYRRRAGGRRVVALVALGSAAAALRLPARSTRRGWSRRRPTDPCSTRCREASRRRALDWRQPTTRSGGPLRPCGYQVGRAEAGVRRAGEAASPPSTGGHHHHGARPQKPVLLPAGAGAGGHKLLARTAPACRPMAGRSPAPRALGQNRRGRRGRARAHAGRHALAEAAVDALSRSRLDDAAAVAHQRHQQQPAHGRAALLGVSDAVAADAEPRPDHQPAPGAGRLPSGRDQQGSEIRKRRAEHRPRGPADPALSKGAVGRATLARNWLPGTAGGDPRVTAGARWAWQCRSMAAADRALPARMHAMPPRPARGWRVGGRWARQLEPRVGGAPSRRPRPRPRAAAGAGPERAAVAAPRAAHARASSGCGRTSGGLPPARAVAEPSAR